MQDVYREVLAERWPNDLFLWVEGYDHYIERGRHRYYHWTQSGEMRVKDIGVTNGDLLLLGGGGGGNDGRSGQSWGEAGGAGEALSLTNIAIPPGTYAVSLGAGGGRGNGTDDGENGGDTTVTGLAGASSSGGFGAAENVGGTSGSGFAGSNATSNDDGGNGGGSAGPAVYDVEGGPGTQWFDGEYYAAGGGGKISAGAWNPDGLGGDSPGSSKGYAAGLQGGVVLRHLLSPLHQRVLDDTPVMYLPLTDLARTTDPFDLIENSTRTVVGDPLFGELDSGWRARETATGFGGQDQIDVTTSPVVSNFGVSFWAKPVASVEADTETPSTNVGAINKRYVFGSTAATGTHVLVSMGTNFIGVYEYKYDEFAFYMPCVLAYSGDFTDWTHVTVGWASDAPTLYVNGVAVRSVAASPQAPVTLDPQTVGGALDAPSRFLGYLNHFATYDSTPTATAVAEHYAASFVR